MIKIIPACLLFLLSSLLFPCVAQVADPQKDSTLYFFDFNGIYFQVDPQTGGRISSLKINGEEMLYLSKDNGNNNWGSTFWPSPQAVWTWPPPFELDGDVYTTAISSGKLFLKSKLNQKTGLAFSKTFSAILADTSLLLEYKIFNLSGKDIQVAPWEITRYPAGGLTFFPARISSLLITGDLAPLVKDSAGVSWFNYDSTTVPQKGTPKFYSDGTEGWLAHAERNGNVLIKKFIDSPPSQKAPDPENEIELYTDPSRTYQEVEEQGMYATIPAGDSLSWTVKWFPRALPASISLTTGNSALISYVRAVGADLVTNAQTQTKETDALAIIYPNPSAEKINISCIQSVDKIQLTNSIGQVVAELGNLDKGEFCNIDLSRFNNGIYMLRITNGNLLQLKTLIIEK